MRGDGREQRAHQRGGHDADPSIRHTLDHRGVGHVVSDKRRIDSGEGRLDRGEVGEDEDRRERRDEPRPRTERVIQEVEEERSAERVVGRLRREDALDDVATAARFGAGVPHVPPLHRDRNYKHGHRRVHVGEVRQEPRLFKHRRVRHQRRPAADRRVVHAVHHHRERAGHHDREQEEVRVDRAADAAQARIDERRDSRHRENRPRRNAEHDDADLDRAQQHHRHHHEIVDHAEVQCAERAEKRGGASRITQLVERDVGRCP